MKTEHGLSQTSAFLVTVEAVCALMFAYIEWLALRRAVAPGAWNLVALIGPLCYVILFSLSPVSRERAGRLITGLLGLCGAITYFVVAVAVIVVPLKAYGPGGLTLAPIAVIFGVLSATLAFGAFKYSYPGRSRVQGGALIMLASYGATAAWASFVFGWT